MRRFKPPYRGTIIVDTSVLIDLESEIPDQLKMRGPRHQHGRLTEILPVLGALGYRIVIPEIVMYELTKQVSVNGRLLSAGNHYFRHRSPYSSTRANEQFFQDVHAGRYPNIEIVATPQFQPAEEVLEKNRAVFYKYHHTPNRTAHEKLQKIAQHTRRAQLGDQAMEWILENARKQGAAPGETFVLSVDHLSLDRQNAQYIRDGYANLLDTSGLLKAFTESGLQRTLGLREDVTGVQLRQAVFDAHREEFSEAEKRRYVDSTPDKDYRIGGFFKNDNPFAESLNRAVFAMAGKSGGHGHEMRQLSARNGHANGR